MALHCLGLIPSLNRTIKYLPVEQVVTVTKAVSSVAVTEMGCVRDAVFRTLLEQGCVCAVEALDVRELSDGEKWCL